jgi:two-component system sensor histidine kinase KdpD
MDPMNPGQREADHDSPAPVLSWAGDAVILGVATLGTIAALDLDRPRTAVLVYVLGVMFVGARSGLYRGVLAALIASFIYNFFLSEPVFTLGVTSFDEMVPLLAFNVCAVVSGGLAGRLNDRARAARRAEAKNALLLQLSDQLQQAIDPSDVARIARDTLLGRGIDDFGIYLHHEGTLVAAEDRARPVEQMRTLLAEDVAGQPDRAVQIFDLVGSVGPLGIVRFIFRKGARGREDAPDLQAVTNLLALAIDRCILLEKLSESRVAQRSEELKNALLSSVSHDLRTPLTAIEAAATSLRTFRHTLSPEQEQEMLGTISEQCAKLNRYTANLLDMGRIQAGISNSQLEDVELVDILGVALGSIRKRFPKQEICKEVPVPSAVVQANAAMLEQAIFNVLENAVVHGGGGKPILVRLTMDGESCFLEITDSGPGIPPAEQARVFERFYRGRRLEHREGSGLGLHIAKGFVEAFGGTIHIESPVVENSGTTATISLPLVRQRAGQGGLDAHPDR